MKKRSKRLLVTMIGLGSTGLGADIYQCGPNSFSDQPCGPKVNIEVKEPASSGSNVGFSNQWLNEARREQSQRKRELRRRNEERKAAAVRKKEQAVAERRHKETIRALTLEQHPTRPFRQDGYDRPPVLIDQSSGNRGVVRVIR